MIITKKMLPRRTFLRGVGATLALPMLDAMVPALSGISARAAAPVRRLGWGLHPQRHGHAFLDASGEYRVGAVHHAEPTGPISETDGCLQWTGATPGRGARRW